MIIVHRFIYRYFDYDVLKFYFFKLFILFGSSNAAPPSFRGIRVTPVLTLIPCYTPNTLFWFHHDFFLSASHVDVFYHSVFKRINRLFSCILAAATDIRGTHGSDIDLHL